MIWDEGGSGKVYKVWVPGFGLKQQDLGKVKQLLGPSRLHLRKEECRSWKVYQLPSNSIGKHFLELCPERKTLTVPTPKFSCFQYKVLLISLGWLLGATVCASILKTLR